MKEHKGMFARQVSDFINRYRPALLRLAHGPDDRADANDARAAMESLGRIRRGEEKTFSHDEVWREIEDLEE